jgi:hypothetical protein
MRKSKFNETQIVGILKDADPNLALPREAKTEPARLGS